MDWQVIEKVLEADGKSDRYADYESACREFSWDTARRALAGLPGGAGINIGFGQGIIFN